MSIKLSLNSFLFCFITLLFISCGHDTTINSWQFKQVNDTVWYTASVPGTVHTDLLANNLIKDPFIGTNELDLQWIENSEWEYKTTFQLASDMMQKEHVEINFEGLDTYAKVYLNDSLIIDANNMHHGWSVEIKPLLNDDFNKLYVRFKSPVKEGQKKLEQLPYYIPASNEAKPIGTQTSIFTRKAQYHYGWDWGPRLTTSGIWKPVRFKAWNTSKIEHIKIKTIKASTDTSLCKVTVHTIPSQNLNKQLLIRLKDTEIVSKELFKDDEKIIYEVKIPNAKLWWPNGLGEPYLYDITVDLKVNNKIEDSYYQKLGLRTIDLIQDPDSLGTSFYFKVNDKPIFIKGANYIPADFFNSRAAKKYKRVIQNAVNANMNMLRVWGGAVYENDEFYQLCDEKGILIWQDFMFACAMIPTQKQHIESIEREAESVIKRLNNHVSIALWCGNNESLTGWNQWGWQENYKLSEEDSLTIWNTYDKLFNTTLKGLVSEYGNGNYWASSPSSNINEIQNKFSGDQHEWGVWFNQLPFDEYQHNAGRFISEYGLQSLPELNTIKKFDPSITDWTIDTEALQFRQRSKMPWITDDFDGFDMMNYYINLYFPKANNLEDFIYLSQSAQALCLQTAIESHRRNKPYTMGSLYWQIDDVWPTVSWSTVDYFGNWKAAHYAVKESNKSIIVSPTYEQGTLDISVISDHLEDMSAKLNITLKTLSGLRIQSLEFDCYIKANQNKIMFSEDISNLIGDYNLDNIFLDVSLKKEDNTVIDQSIFYFVKPKDLKLIPPDININISGNEITLTSSSLAKNVYLSAGKIEGHFSDNYFDLTPDTPKTITFSTKGSIENLQSIIKIKSLVDIERSESSFK